MHAPARTKPGDETTGGFPMDAKVLALVQHAERELRMLATGLDDVRDWDGDVAVLVSLQTIAATLVDAARRHAEDLSRHAVDRRRDHR